MFHLRDLRDHLVLAVHSCHASTTLAQTMQRSSHFGSTAHEQVDQYLAEVQRLTANQLPMPSDALSFWQQKTSYNLLVPVAEDFICAPASKAFVERYFLCVAFSAVAVAAACTSHWKCACAEMRMCALPVKEVLSTF